MKLLLLFLLAVVVLLAQERTNERIGRLEVRVERLELEADKAETRERALHDIVIAGQASIKASLWTMKIGWGVFAGIAAFWGATRSWPRKWGAVKRWSNGLG